MRNWKVLCLVAVLLACLLAGCGNVYLRGDAMTAAQQSTMDAYQAVLRCGGDGALPYADATTQPASGTIKAYLVNNFKQWRSFVRSAKCDLTWGPKLAGEQ